MATQPLSKFRPQVFLSKQFALFAIVGVVGAAAHWVYRYVINLFVSYELALVLAYGLSLLTGFLLSKFFVFPLSTRPVAHQASYFVAFHLAMFPVVFGISYVLSDFVFNHFLDLQWARGCAHLLAVIAPAVLNFLFQKYFVFEA